MDWEQVLEDFFSEGTWILAPDKQNEGEYYCYWWDNFEQAEKFFDENKNDVHIYTIVEEEGDLWIYEGFRFVNRVTHMFSVQPIELQEPILYYPSEEVEEG